jgi:heme/copper-type cytochrome/quinol oxidase subunit 2
MKPETKKKIIIGVGIFEALVVVTLFIISIIALATMEDKDFGSGFIKDLQRNPNMFMWIIVVPLIIIFVVDGLYLLYIYLIARKADEKAKAVTSNLSEEDKAKLLAEVKAELMKEEAEKNSKPEEKK